MELVGGEFTECVVAYRDVWLPARNVVQKAIEKRQEVCTLACSYANIFDYHVWQSQVEIEHYSVAYFNCVTAFKAL